MTLLPEGWEADYDGTRWFYRYKATGLTQYHFPRLGDEFPELVGLGFGPLDGAKHGDVATKLGGNETAKATSNDNKDVMGATGYFDPDQFMYFGLNDISPVGNENDTPTSNNGAVLAELPEPERIQSPVGFVAELASSETAKCAEELAPIELDATQLAPTTLQVATQQDGPTELPTSGSPVEKKKPTQRPSPETMEPVEEYPLVSASFAYPPLKTATRPAENAVRPTNPPTTEPKVLSSQRPDETQANQNKYETWKPGPGGSSEELSDSNKKPIALSSISVLQSQSNELGPIEQKRHSLPGPTEGVSVPDILKKPSDPGTTAVSTPALEVETSQIPAALQPAAAPQKTDSSGDNSQEYHVQSSVPSLPGSGARHESISFGSGLSIIDSSSYQISSVPKPVQSTSTLEGQTLGQISMNNNITGLHRVNTLPNQISSHASSLPKINGPGIYVFQEISATPGYTVEQVQDKPQNPSASLQQLDQTADPFYSVMNEPLPVIAPLSVSKPQTPTSPNQASAGLGISEGSRPPNSQQSQGPTSPVASSIGVTAHPSQVNYPAVSQGSSPSPSKPPHKLLRKPVLPQRPNTTSTAFENPVVGSASIPIRPFQSSPQQGTPSTVTAASNLAFQAQAYPSLPQAVPVASLGQHVPTHCQRPQSISGPSQYSTQVSHHPTSQSVVLNSQAPTQGHNHGLAIAAQVSGQASYSGTISTQPLAGQAAIANPASTVQRPPTNPSQQATQDAKPTVLIASPIPTQHIPAGINIGANKPHYSWSPTVHSVSPLQSQVSSPAPSIASLQRPPSSASSHAQSTTQGVIPTNRPPTTTAHQTSPPAPRPTGPQVAHSQGHIQGVQSSNSPGNGASKPFPMLPGQVKPMPSQVGSPPMPVAAQPVQTALTQAQHLQGQMAPTKPTQQQGTQQAPQVAMHRPPQPQQHVQGHHAPVAGQQIPGVLQQHGQPQPPAQIQQHIPVQSPQSTQIQGQQYPHQGVGQTSQAPGGQQAAGFTQGTHVQQHVPQSLQCANVTNPSAAQSFNTGQPTAQTQGQQYQQNQQLAQVSGPQSVSPQVYGQGKPFNSAQATAAVSDASKKLKKWAKKTWQNPSFKQATAAVGGAVFAESLGGNGVAGAALANRIYANSQNKPQNNQPQRPPGLQHANTAPPQVQQVAGMNATTQYYQAMIRPQLQQGMQPVGVQTPGRPPVMQSPGAAGAAANNPSQLRPGMINQQPAQQVQRPPVGRPPVTQAQQQQQQATTFSQPFYQGAQGQPVFQASPNQPLYQIYPGQQGYQVQPNQQPLQAQMGTDTYAAIGATLGGALSSLAGGKPDPGASAGSQQQYHHATNTEPQHESHSTQNNESYTEPHHEAHSEQYHGGQSGEHHTEHAVQQEPYSDQQNTTYSDSQIDNSQTVTDNSTSEAYFAPQSDTTIINNTTINNIDNTEIAQSQQVNTNYTDNTNITDTNNVTSETNMYADTSYIIDTSNTGAQGNTFTDTMYTDTTYVDATNMNTDTTSFADATYIDASYAGVSYTDAAYVDTTTMVDVSVDMSVSVDASYTEVSTTDYSGGDWGGGDW
ncbi:hypothetical protein F5Y02DRAFT_370518 [Annulohypoxylon stygium]|nr:hypothetical protein F5Y02DRAFT_370518 [Annulohypoxylon stygium]